MGGAHELVVWRQLALLHEELGSNCVWIKDSVWFGSFYFGGGWFIDSTMSQPIPHFATINHAFANRFDSEPIAHVFTWILIVDVRMLSNLNLKSPKFSA